MIYTYNRKWIYTYNRKCRFSRYKACLELYRALNTNIIPQKVEIAKNCGIIGRFL